MLYGGSLWLGLAILVVVRVRAYGAADEPLVVDAAARRAAAVAIGIVVALAAPVIVRPLMDGDTVIYHLPLAASFVARHGIWTTNTRYWWYPAGSELFAAGLFATSGLRDVGLAGVVPALLLLWRIASAPGTSRMAAALAGCGLLATSVAAHEIVSLQNDIWVSALFDEFVVARDIVSGAVLALTKPSGTAFALVGAFERGPLGMLAFLPLAVWFARDAALSQTAIVSIASSAYPNIWSSTMLAHPREALVLLPSVLGRAGPAWFCIGALSIAGVCSTRDCGMRATWFGALAVFLIAPFGFTNGTPQFASGQSLRFVLPCVALGTYLAVASDRLHRGALLGIGLAASTLGVLDVRAVFANDAMTSNTPAFAVLAALFAFFAIGSRFGRPISALAPCVACAVFAMQSGTRPVAYFAGGFARGGVPSGAFTVLVRQRPPRVVTLGIPAGDVIGTVPGSDVSDAAAASTACAQAAAENAIVVAAVPALPDASGCGRTLYRDEAIIVLESQSAWPRSNGQRS